MKKILRSAGIIICILVSAGYIFCALTAYIPPSSLSITSTFALIFPYALLTIALVCLVSFFIKRRTGFLLLIVIALGYKNIFSTFAMNAGSKWENKKDTNDLRILTWNVLNFFSIERDKLKETDAWKLYLKQIKEWQPDILCFQEYKNVELRNKFYSIRTRFDSMGYKYYYCSNDTIVNKTGMWTSIYGCAIYSKVPLIESSKTNILKQGRNESLISSDFLFKNKRIRIFTAHLASFSLYNISNYADKNMYQETLERSRSVFYKIKNREVLHESQVRKVRNEIDKSPYPVIYCGDINSTPASYTYHSLKQNLQDAFIKKGFGIGRTFYKLGPTLRIDVCLVDDNFKVSQVTVPNVFISDHFPVLTDIHWNE